MREIPVIAGPTAVGKSSLALALAEQYNAEIISADSRQIYKYLDIGTAKPTKSELKKIPHHLIDILEPDESYSAARFASEARAVMEKLERQGKRFMIVGGTGLYIRALIDGLSQIPPADAGIRNELNKIAEKSGCESLHAILTESDPDSAKNLKVKDKVRIIRALEVFRITGIPMSQWQKGERVKDGRKYRLIVLNMEREFLYRRIEDRVDDMIARGLFGETEKIIRMGFSRDVNAFKTVGYNESIAFLNGEIARERTVELIKQNTRRYAKRQITWFRGMPQAEWIDIAGDEAGELSREISDRLKGWF
jgi:tRNA dimethylallyltransferase